MAPNGHAPKGSPAVDKNSRPQTQSRWHERHGSAEFKLWQEENPTRQITYDDWKTSEHVNGLALYYAALHVFDDSTSSDEEVELAKIESRPRAVRAHSAREPKKLLKTNGNGVLRPAASAIPTATARTENASPSARKKRKTPKKYLSEELVASEESDHGETGTPNAPVITVNGRRKSSNRKPRKKPISEEIISPEDEEEDPMATLNGLATPAIASPLPVRSAPKSPAAVQVTESPKRTILKLSTRKAPKKKVLSEETILDDDTDEGAGVGAAAHSTVAAVAEPNITATTESHTPLAASSVAASNDATASPDPTSDSAATRRGLRMRRPAQQRPYSYDAQIYEEHETDVPEEDIYAHTSPQLAQSRRVSTVSYGRGFSEDQIEELDQETLAILQGDLDPEPDKDTGRPKHFKGKGRAWKKEESDEDLEFTVGKKKKKAAAAARAKAKDANQPPRKRGRPRKTVMSEDVVRDDSDSEPPPKSADASPSRTTSEAPAKKTTRKPPRKSALSEEIVRDDSDSDTQPRADAGAQGVTTPEAKESEGATAAQATETEQVVSYTPKGTPNQSHAPSSEPKHVRLSITNVKSENTIVDKHDNAGLDNATRSSSPVDDIEKHMASVNADDDDEMEL
ncbi:hypothetical protein FB567DRAFT_511781 [Paraphoma chrysanthemicola]|uniref:Uncharacterized protein n=1 Tax=Paraphoma chrysanthemicola TaxID=798071 RepID=A0A8K0RJV0_9PLEO|nr:hypothetical protein FB567DRAFT_511781 [Paraphoma chrysanthemicola]